MSYDEAQVVNSDIYFGVSTLKGWSQYFSTEVLHEILFRFLAPFVPRIKCKCLLLCNFLSKQEVP